MTAPAPAPVALPPAAAPAPIEDDAPVGTRPPEQEHWVYGTTTHTLVGPEGETVACEDERVCFLYPMVREGEVVRMRAKTADPDTGQLAHTWVTVFNAVTGARHVSKFSVVP